MKLEELLAKYEINHLTLKKFHKDLLVYYNCSMKPMFSKRTEMELLNNRQMEICKRYKINFPTFTRNLNLLTQYKQFRGGRN